MDNVSRLIEEMRVLSRGDDPGRALAQICIRLREEIPHYDWVGFYIAYPQEELLVLGPFEGAPTDHVRIPYGTGICGQAAATGNSHWVDDVNAEGNYLACSRQTKSEVVIPVYHEDRFVGELDIDSHQRAPFTDRDHELLNGVVTISAPLVAHLADGLRP
ncbi:MAG: GAF domain-containing protein [Spirochaetales bacterium]